MAGSVASHRRKFSIADARACRLGSAPSFENGNWAVRRPRISVPLRRGATTELTLEECCRMAAPLKSLRNARFNIAEMLRSIEPDCTD
jgi:hypothetical protein